MTPPRQIARMRELGERERALEAELRDVDGELRRALEALPNLPSEDAAAADTVLRTVGEPRPGPLPDHLELAGAADRHGGRRARSRARASPTSRATS